MNKDGCYTVVHMHNPRNADLFEDVCRDHLPSDDIFVPLQHQPINPEDEDDVVPDQHAAFGIQRATQTVREPAWKDLGLAQLMRRGPGGPRGGGGGPANGSAGSGLGGPGSGGGGGPSAVGGGHLFSRGDNAYDTSSRSYAYYAYYYGYNANGIGNIPGAGAAVGPGATGAGSSGSPSVGSAGAATRGHAGTGRPYRGMPR